VKYNRVFDLPMTHWLVAQIEFTEWTPDGHLRHSRFVGWREDKAAREVVREGLKPRRKRNND
jgi:ATP-dependent DNA ligase